MKKSFFKIFLFFLLSFFPQQPAKAACIVNCAGQNLTPSSSPIFASLSLTGTLTFTDAALVNKGTNILGLANSTNAQQFNIYNTDPAANKEWVELGWQAITGSAVLRTNRVSGGVLHALTLAYSGTANPAITVPNATSGIIDLGGGGAATAFFTVRTAFNAQKTAASGTAGDLMLAGSVTPGATSTLLFESLSIVPTVNYANVTPGAGAYRAINIAVTETALPTGANYLIYAAAGVAGTTEEFSVTNAGVIRVQGTAGLSVTCSAMPTAMAIKGGIITSVTGGTCS